jgi:hypothetical protein
MVAQELLDLSVIRDASPFVELDRDGVRLLGNQQPDTISSIVLQLIEIVRVAHADINYTIPPPWNETRIAEGLIDVPQDGFLTVESTCRPEDAHGTPYPIVQRCPPIRFDELYMTIT